MIYLETSNVSCSTSIFFVLTFSIYDMIIFRGFQEDYIFLFRAVSRYLKRTFESGFETPFRGYSHSISPVTTFSFSDKHLHPPATPTRSNLKSSPTNKLSTHEWSPLFGSSKPYRVVQPRTVKLPPEGECFKLEMSRSQDDMLCI